MSDRLVLNLHGIGATPPAVPAAERRYWCGVRQFEALLDSVGPLSAQAELPIEITFDDGNLSDAAIALPALSARGLRATFFVCAGRIGHPDYLDAAALQDLLGAGMQVGSHGWDHVDWRRCDDAALRRETRGALDRIAEVTGRAVDRVGIPFGSYDRRVLAWLRQCEAQTVYTSDRGHASDNAWLVPRLSWTTEWHDGTLREAMRSAGLLAKGRSRLSRLLKQVR